MEEQKKENTRPANPRRKKRSKLQIFKEAYLPFLIVLITFVMSLIFIIGSSTRKAEQKEAELQASIAASVAAQEQQEQEDLEAARLMEEAAKLAAGHDYDGALAVLDSFQGDFQKQQALCAMQDEYIDIITSLVVWDDPSKIPNLSFQLLIADPQRAFSNTEYGTSYNRNFVTIFEFSAILEQLYNNGYVLVGLEDCVILDTADGGTVAFTGNEILLPEGKKPFMLTQVQVNYNTFMIDGNGDKIADKDGAGFASKLLLDESGYLVCEYVDSEGQTYYGDYDLIPILEKFIQTHPDFSYKGARATIGLTGYDGILGYRTTPAAQQHFGNEVYKQNVADATAMVNELRSRGYHIACYTYDNIPYGSTSVADIQADLGLWKHQTTDILGSVKTLIYARDSDIASAATAYSGDRYNALKSAGFTHYLGFCTDGTPWAVCTDEYFRQGRILVSGSTMTHHADWFSGIFDPAEVLDTTRGQVPQ